MSPERTKQNIFKALLYLFLIILAVLCLVPFWMMLVNSTRSGNEIMTSFSLLPGASLGTNWDLVSANLDLFKGMGNSLFIAVCTTVLCSYFSALTAYALSCYTFKGNNLLFIVMLVFMMVPSQLSLLGFYDLCNALGLIDSYIPLIIPAIASSGTVFFLRQYLMSVLPKAAEQPVTAGQMGLSPQEPGLPVVLINDGRLMEKALRAQGLDRNWLEQRLTEHGVCSPSQVFLLTVDEAGSVCFVAREAM